MRNISFSLTTRRLNWLNLKSRELNLSMSKPIIESPFMASVRERERLAKRTFARPVSVVVAAFVFGVLLGVVVTLAVVK